MGLFSIFIRVKKMKYNILSIYQENIIINNVFWRKRNKKNKGKII